ncbi:hypothetical protein ACO2Q8_09355 [Larkinella sp. VNQ87]|uniref:hypothetical protein n=1 Tax=Larkinella sp. VNQ87 TaxID=3400921 RepID=UPI003BFE34E0
MKKLFLTASFIVTAFLTNAQTNKGQGIWTGSVSLGYSSQKNKSGFSDFSNQSSAYGLNVTRGAFFKDNWLLGVGLTTGLVVSNFRGTGIDRPEYVKSTQYGLGLNGFVRRYWG